MAFVRSPDNISIELLQAGQDLPPAEPWVKYGKYGLLVRIVTIFTALFAASPSHSVPTCAIAGLWMFHPLWTPLRMNYNEAD